MSFLAVLIVVAGAAAQTPQVIPTPIVVQGSVTAQSYATSDTGPTAIPFSTSPTAPVYTLGAAPNGIALTNPDQTQAPLLTGEAHIQTMTSAAFSIPLTATYTTKPACFASAQGFPAVTRAWATPVGGTIWAAQLRGVKGDTVSVLCVATTPPAPVTLKRRKR